MCVHKKSIPEDRTGPHSGVSYYKLIEGLPVQITT